MSLIQCPASEIHLFSPTPQSGLGAPTHFAYASIGGPQIVTPGKSIDPGKMIEPWVLVWFSGAKGWTNWDAPWVAFLQHKPKSMRLDETGLQILGQGPIGRVVLLPLYGYRKAPLPGKDFAARYRLPLFDVHTDQWGQFLRTPTLQRVRFWSSVAKEFPYACDETFSVDVRAGKVTIRNKFDWISTDDDWNTPHLKLAPISPPLALAYNPPLGLSPTKKTFPVTFSRTPWDLDYFSPYGPCIGIQDVDQYEASLSVLGWVNRTEHLSAALITNQSVVIKSTLEKINAIASKEFDGNPTLTGKVNVQEQLDRDLWLSRSLPYLDPVNRTKVTSGLKHHFSQILENAETVRQPTNDFPGNFLPAIWAYSHFTSDWTLVRKNWVLIKESFGTSSDCRWVTFGRGGKVEQGEEAARSLAFARLAYQAGDIDSYNYGCYLVAGDLVRLYARNRGIDYFRDRQPWNSEQAMDQEVYLTGMNPGSEGWRIEGPHFPAEETKRTFDNRWNRFNDFDVAGFFRDQLQDESRVELKRITRSKIGDQSVQNDDLLARPSLFQLRSLLLNELPQQITKLPKMETTASARPEAMILADAVCLLRTVQTHQSETLIEGLSASPFVLGMQREVARPHPYLMQDFAFEKSLSDAHGAYPMPVWSKWKSPGETRFSFGRIVPAAINSVFGTLQTEPLSWNSERWINSGK
ncbi:MAG: hypothetical protein JWN25_569 [Verrucomicrobiales bacterium]|nr:hypothetical protein [Verrucomicrobiales bacterium]